MWLLRDRSDFLYTHQYLRKRRLYLIVFVSNNLFLYLMLRVHWYSMEAIIGLLFTHSIVNSSNIPLVFLGEKELNIIPRHVCNSFTWARMAIPSKSFFAGAIIKPNSIGAVCIFVTNVIAAFAFIDVYLEINRRNLWDKVKTFHKRQGQRQTKRCVNSVLGILTYLPKSCRSKPTLNSRH